MYDLIIFAIIYFIAGKIIISVFSTVMGVKERILNLALFFRMAITYTYYYYTIRLGGDALYYYTYAKDIGISGSRVFFQPGTQFIQNIASFFFPMVSFFDNSYLMLYIPFSILAFIGSLLFYKALLNLGFGKTKLSLFLSFFLPNLVFWTSNIGKDSVIYLGITGLIYFLTEISKKSNMIKNVLFISLFCAIIYFVRPHVFSFFLFAFLLGYFLQKRKLSVKSVSIFIIAFFLVLSLQSKICDYVGIDADEQSFESYYGESMEYVEEYSGRGQYTRANIEREGKVSILLSPWYAIRWLLEPFIWQIKTSLHLLGVIDGLVYLYFLLYIIVNLKIFVKSDILPYKYSWLMYVIIASAIFGMAYANFGLNIRQKTMVLPAIILIYATIIIEKGKKDATT